MWVVSAAKLQPQFSSLTYESEKPPLDVNVSSSSDSDEGDSSFSFYSSQHCGPFKAVQVVLVLDLSDLPAFSPSLSLSRSHLANDEAHALYHGYACSESTSASLRPKRTHPHSYRYLWMDHRESINSPGLIYTPTTHKKAARTKKAQ